MLKRSSKPLAAITVAALAVAAFAPDALSAQRTYHRHHPAHHSGTPQPHQIACTVLGCMPAVAACTPVAGKTPGGRPTGFDVIACPPGPGH